MGVARDSRNFSGHPYIGCIARCDSTALAFLFYIVIVIVVVAAAVVACVLVLMVVT